MPISFDLELNYFELKYELTAGWKIQVDDVERSRRLHFQCSSTKEFLIACASASVGVAAIGLTTFLLRKFLKIPAIAVTWSSVIFQVTIPNDKKPEFAQYVEKELANELNKSFAEVEKYLKDELGDDFNEKGQTLATKLKNTKIVESTLCSDEKVQEAKVESKKQKVPPPPMNVRVVENADKPSTTFLVFYDRPPKEDIDKYIVTATEVGGLRHQEKETCSTQEFALLEDLNPGKTYLVSVRSVKDDAISPKCILKQPKRTALYDPYPWKTPSSRLSGGELELPKDSDVQRFRRGSNWSTADDDTGDESAKLRREMCRILRFNPKEGKTRDLMNKLYELGITQAQDLKYIGDKEVIDKLREVLKVVDVLKLVDYAQDEYTARTESTEQGEGVRELSILYNMASQKIVLGGGKYIPSIGSGSIGQFP